MQRLSTFGGLSKEEAAVDALLSEAEAAVAA
jgi:hypothetical protein